MRQEIKDARALKIMECAEKRMSKAATARLLSVGVHTIIRYAKDYGIKFDPRPTPDQLKADAEAGLSLQEFSKKYGIPYTTAARIARLAGIKFRRTGTGTRDGARLETIISMYKAGKTLADIGALYGVSRERVRQLMTKYAGVTAKDGGKAFTIEIRKRQRRQREEAYYFTKHGCTPEQYRAARDEAKHARENGYTSKAPLNAFTQQRGNAARRGIGWSLKFWDWWMIWEASGHWEQRGRGKAYVMCRFGDVGAYEIGNVYIATGVHNATVQPNNPYRSSHPDFKKTMADRITSQQAAA